MAQAVPLYSQQNNWHVHIMTMPTHLALNTTTIHPFRVYIVYTLKFRSSVEHL